MVLVPGFTPVTTPVVEFTVAVLVLLEDQAPPVNPSVYVVVKPLFKIVAPAISGMKPVTKFEVAPVKVNTPIPPTQGSAAP